VNVGKKVFILIMIVSAGACIIAVLRKVIQACDDIREMLEILKNKIG
jgi:hypothetical protein